MSGQSTRRGQRGIALAIVVWFIAGMAILVAGIVAQASVDVRMAQVHVARAKVAAAGDGAIMLMMSDLQRARRETPPVDGTYRTAYKLGTLDVEVELVLTSKLMNVNSADAPSLKLLFTEVAALDAGEAQNLADNVVQWRHQLRSQFSKMEALEDLMAAGVPRTVLDAVRDHVVAGSPLYRADAIVRYGDSSWLRRRWVSNASGPYSALPWVVLRTETPRVVNR
ncbi:MAG: hypothetical protein ABJ084_15620 [Halioglobus sp.]